MLIDSLTLYSVAIGQSVVRWIADQHWRSFAWLVQIFGRRALAVYRSTEGDESTFVSVLLAFISSFMPITLQCVLQSFWNCLHSIPLIISFQRNSSIVCNSSITLPLLAFVPCCVCWTVSVSVCVCLSTCRGTVIRLIEMCVMSAIRLVEMQEMSAIGLVEMYVMRCDSFGWDMSVFVFVLFNRSVSSVCFCRSLRFIAVLFVDPFPSHISLALSVNQKVMNLTRAHAEWSRYVTRYVQEAPQDLDVRKHQIFLPRNKKQVSLKPTFWATFRPEMSRMRAEWPKRAEREQNGSRTIAWEQREIKMTSTWQDENKKETPGTIFSPIWHSLLSLLISFIFCSHFAFLFINFVHFLRLIFSSLHNEQTFQQVGDAMANTEMSNTLRAKISLRTYRMFYYQDSEVCNSPMRASIALKLLAFNSPHHSLHLNHSLCLYSPNVSSNHSEILSSFPFKDYFHRHGTLMTGPDPKAEARSQKFRAWLGLQSYLNVWKMGMKEETNGRERRKRKKYKNIILKTSLLSDLTSFECCGDHMTAQKAIRSYKERKTNLSRSIWTFFSQSRFEPLSLQVQWPYLSVFRGTLDFRTCLVFSSDLSPSFDSFGRKRGEGTPSGFALPHLSRHFQAQNYCSLDRRDIRCSCQVILRAQRSEQGARRKEERKRPPRTRKPRISQNGPRRLLWSRNDVCSLPFSIVLSVSAECTDAQRRIWARRVIVVNIRRLRFVEGELACAALICCCNEREVFAFVSFWNAEEKEEKNKIFSDSNREIICAARFLPEVSNAMM